MRATLATGDYIILAAAGDIPVGCYPGSIETAVSTLPKHMPAVVSILQCSRVTMNERCTQWRIENQDNGKFVLKLWDVAVRPACVDLPPDQDMEWFIEETQSDSGEAYTSVHGLVGKSKCSQCSPAFGLLFPEARPAGLPQCQCTTWKTHVGRAPADRQV